MKIGIHCWWHFSQVWNKYSEIFFHQLHTTYNWLFYYFMFSDYELFGSARRSLSNNKYKLTYSRPTKPTQKTKTLANVLKKILHLKISNHFNVLKESVTEKKNNKEKINSLCKIIKIFALRHGFSNILLDNKRKIKLGCAFQLLAFTFRRMQN